MFDQWKSLSLAAALTLLLAPIAAAQNTPRLELDWEPDPKDSSYIKVTYDRCGDPRIVSLTGGKKIRPRVRNASSSGR